MKTLWKKHLSCVVFVSLSGRHTEVAKISCQAPNTALASDANSFLRCDFLTDRREGSFLNLQTYEEIQITEITLRMFYSYYIE